MITRKEQVYLAGPMEDCTHEQMTNWRIISKDVIEINNRTRDFEIGVLDPTRRVSFHDQMEGTLQGTVKNMNICKRIFKQDLEDIARSKVILADVRRSSGKGTGTSMELMFAHMKNKIIIMFGDEEDFVHPFYEAIYTEKYYNLADALNGVMEYF